MWGRTGLRERFQCAESRHSIARRHIESYNYVLVCVKGFSVLIESRHSTARRHIEKGWEYSL